MKDLTKSLTSFSWAMSLFGARQMMNLVDPGQASRAFDSVTRAAEGQMDESLRSTFRLGDRVQRSMVDATFSILRVGGLDPAAWSGAAGRVMDQATEAATGAARETARAAGAGADPAWTAGGDKAARDRPSGVGSGSARSSSHPASDEASGGAAGTGWGPMEPSA